nr:hypothetical protein KitaXyl93_62360 [Kitasatospora sp. Xyl93]
MDGAGEQVDQAGIAGPGDVGDPARTSPRNRTRPRSSVTTRAFMTFIRVFPGTYRLRPGWLAAGRRTRISVASMIPVCPVAPRCAITSAEAHAEGRE